MLTTLCVLLHRLIQGKDNRNESKAEWSEAALNAIELLLAMKECNKETSTEELKKVINDLGPSKALGTDRIPSEVIKCAKGVLFKDIHGLLCWCWKEEAVPQDMMD